MMPTLSLFLSIFFNHPSKGVVLVIMIAYREKKCYHILAAKCQFLRGGKAWRFIREARRPPEDVRILFECQLQSTFGCETVVHPHVHEQFEVLYCRKGGFELFSGGALTPFGPGDMVLIDPTRSTTRAPAPRGKTSTRS